MQKIFDRSFVAVNLQGQSYTIGDLAQLMEDYGLHRFFKTFGFNHGKIAYYPSSSHVDYRTLKEVWVARKHEAEFEFVITDGFGRQYCPAYLLEQLFIEQPKRAKNLWEKSIYKRYSSFGYKRCKNWRLRNKGRYRHPSVGKLFAQEATLKEEGVKGIRNLKDYYECPWDGRGYRFKQKNWKKQRKTQYK